ncbi:MAG: pseudouridine synthase [Bacteroidales bacterium]|nr:pseudouridine synthase [Lentimicrobiaceae bacterium]MDD5694570.1 pseudouridine synthase [Bacteroidales bacterium]
MRPRKGKSAGPPANPEFKPPVPQQESARRKEFFESRRPRKKVLILDKEEKTDDNPEPRGIKILRKTKNSQPGRTERPSADIRKSAGASPGAERKRKSYGEPGATGRPARSAHDAERKRRSYGEPGAAGRPARSAHDAERKRRPYGEPGAAGRPARSAHDAERKKRPYGTAQDKDRPGSSFGKNRDAKVTGPGRTAGFRKSLPDPEMIRLNKFIANAGVCSRREADELIRAGAIRVNGKIVTELGVKVSRKDKIQYGDQTLRAEPLVYVLLNKPKGYITTVDDPLDRNTVMTLVKDASRYRIYPVGRLDRNTTGLLLFTNDGELAKKLSHPRHRIEKIYHVELDRNLTKNDMMTIAAGITLEDGFVKVDEIAWVEGADSKKEIGIRLHSGKNRVVRRIFEHLEYRVIRLDRVVFAGLTKKDLPRGRWRPLSKEEISRLKRL